MEEGIRKRRSGRHQLHPYKHASGLWYVRGTIGGKKVHKSLKTYDEDTAKVMAAVEAKRLGMTTVLEAVEATQKVKGEFIYCVGQSGSHYVKIGVANNLPERVKTLQTGNPHELSVLFSLPGGVPEERALHWLFTDRRMIGEWFDDTAGDIRAWFRGRAIQYEAIKKRGAGVKEFERIGRREQA